MKTGIAFQMADDILDYMADEGELGKRLGKDLKEGKTTLPLLYLLKSASETERDEIKAIVRGTFKKSGLRKILDLFKKYHSIELSLKRAHDLIADAKNELAVFPDSRAKEGLNAIADYTLQRRK
jgi:octaprenyl-diphosphate synthase